MFDPFKRTTVTQAEQEAQPWLGKNGQPLWHCPVWNALAGDCKRSGDYPVPTSREKDGQDDQQAEDDERG